MYQVQQVFLASMYLKWIQVTRTVTHGPGPPQTRVFYVEDTSSSTIGHILCLILNRKEIFMKPPYTCIILGYTLTENDWMETNSLIIFHFK